MRALCLRVFSPLSYKTRRKKSRFICTGNWEQRCSGQIVRRVTEPGNLAAGRPESRTVGGLSRRSLPISVSSAHVEFLWHTARDENERKRCRGGRECPCLGMPVLDLKLSHSVSLRPLLRNTLWVIASRVLPGTAWSLSPCPPPGATEACGDTLSCEPDPLLLRTYRGVLPGTDHKINNR